ncbi:hypothetical protein AMAG_20756 [Allomyces macrogynus ATCC 38327]|uniref:Uncharacterized protein n=1 Tax=Allomyces macrogynus (strain ATCC 38327) TaxID=578462 RepID=A0A0L0TEY9_ALLM3|nr:hypothetical protein AMAG_20756 [Allomyces macrogynus ATCC 38327]|eukprot:KNE73413.1 hypothetical protein AMAG_20756 [Allomyces macrogynus ATCC 38327]
MSFHPNHGCRPCFITSRPSAAVDSAPRTVLALLFSPHSHNMGDVMFGMLIAFFANGVLYFGWAISLILWHFATGTHQSGGLHCWAWICVCGLVPSPCRDFVVAWPPQSDIACFDAMAITYLCWSGRQNRKTTCPTQPLACCCAVVLVRRLAHAWCD